MPAGNLTPNLHVSGGGEVVIPMQRVDDPYTNISDVSFTHSSSHLLMEAYPFHFVSWRCLLCVSFFLLVCVMWCFFSLLCIWFVFRINSIAYIISDVSFIVFMCCFISFQNSCVCVSFFLLVCFFSVCLWFIVVFLFITLCIDLRFVFILLHIHFRCVLCVAPFHFRCFIFICVAPFHFRCVFHSISYSFSGVTIVHRSITNNLYTKSTHQIEKIKNRHFPVNFTSINTGEDAAMIVRLF